MPLVLGDDKRFGLVLFHENFIEVVWNLGGNTLEESIAERPDVARLQDPPG